MDDLLSRIESRIRDPLGIRKLRRENETLKRIVARLQRRNERLSRDLNMVGSQDKAMFARPFRYLHEGRLEDAEKAFDELFGDTHGFGEGHIVAYEYTGSIETTCYFPDPILAENLKFVRKLTIKSLGDADAALRYDLVADHYRKLLQRVPYTLHVGKYVLEEEIVGPDLFLLFQIIDSIHKETSETSFGCRLKDSLLNTWLDDAVLFQCNPFPFEESDWQVADYRKTFGESLELLAEPGERPSEELVDYLSRRIECARKVPFCDRALWNGLLDIHGIVGELPETDLYTQDTTIILREPKQYTQIIRNMVRQILMYAEQRPDEQERVIGLFEKNLYHIDFDKSNRLSFPEYDFLLIFGTQVTCDVDLPEKQRRYLSTLAAAGGITQDLFEDYEFRRFYRQLRSAFFRSRTVPRFDYSDISFYVETAKQAIRNVAMQDYESHMKTNGRT